MGLDRASIPPVGGKNVDHLGQSKRQTVAGPVVFAHSRRLGELAAEEGGSGIGEQLGVAQRSTVAATAPAATAACTRVGSSTLDSGAVQRIDARNPLEGHPGGGLATAKRRMAHRWRTGSNYLVEQPPLVQLDHTGS